MNPTVFDAVSRFTGAGTWRDRHEVFRKFVNTLRSPEALKLLEYNAANSRHSPHIRRALSARVRLLEKKPKEIEAVYADRERLFDAVEKFINAGSLAEAQEVVEASWEALSGVGADQVFADFLLQDREDDEIDFIEARWDALEGFRARGGPRAPVRDRPRIDAKSGSSAAVRQAAETAGAGRKPTLDDPIEAFLSTGRWSETQRLLEVATDDLFRPQALDAIEARAKITKASEQRAWIESRLQLLRAAQRFGVLGAYAFAQGFGQGGAVIPAELIREFQEAMQSTERLQDLCDRHPILISIYQKMRTGQNPVGPLPPPQLPPTVNAAFRVFLELQTETSPARIIDRLAPIPSRLDPRLYPGLCGAFYLRLGDARAKLDGSDAGLLSAMVDFDAARAIFTADRFPIDHGETALYVGRALLERGHVDRAVLELVTALKYLDVAAREDTLLMAIAPRSVDEIRALHARAELLHSEALWKARRYEEAREQAREIEERYAASNPEVAAQACLLQMHLARLMEGRDADDRVQVGEDACRRGLQYLSGVEPVPDTAIRLQAQLINLLLRPEGYKMAERVAQAGALLEKALRAVDKDCAAAAELRLVEHQFITEHAHPRGSKARAQECAREILRLAKILRDPKLEAEGHVRVGDVATAKDVLKHYRRAANQFGKVGEYEAQADLLRRIGDRCFDAKDWKAAVRAYNEARATEPRLAGDATDAFARSAKTAAFFPKAAYAAHKLGRHTEALLVSEAGKARFLRAMARSRAKTDDSILHLLGGAASGALVVIPIVTAHGTITFVVPGDARSVSVEHVIETETDDRAWMKLLTEWMNAYFKYTAEQDIRAWENTVGEMCKQLWVLLMGSVRQRIGELKVQRGLPILFVPPSLLAPLPFHAAWDPDGRYPFAEDYALAYAPGLNLLPSSVNLGPAAGPPNMLAFIDPDGDLPFSHYELRCLKRYARRGHLRAFEGKKAQCKRFFEHAGRMDYLHFACHGFHQWAKALETGVKLADGGLGALSFLSSDVDLKHTRLACLSACETGITTAFRRLYGNTMTFGGEEYMGLPGALHAAGVERVLSTLWPVEDYVATLLLEKFYRLHLAEKLDCFDALRGARKSLRGRTAAATISDIRQRLSEPDVSDVIAGHLEEIKAFVEREYKPNDHPFDHPNCWAPYVLSGSPGARQSKSS